MPPTITTHKEFRLTESTTTPGPNSAAAVALAIGHVTGPMAMAGPHRRHGRNNNDRTKHNEDDSSRLGQRSPTPSSPTGSNAARCTNAAVRKVRGNTRDVVGARSCVARRPFMGFSTGPICRALCQAGGYRSTDKSAARVGAVAPSARDRPSWSGCRTPVCADAWRVGDDPPVHRGPGPHGRRVGLVDKGPCAGDVASATYVHRALVVIARSPGRRRVDGAPT